MTERAETIKTERRRRDTSALGGVRQRLAVTGELDRENFEYRWIVNEGTRVHDLTVKDDWEIVTDRSGTLKMDGQGVGAAVETLGGTDERGAAIKQVLVRKRKAWYQDDERAKSARIDASEAGIRAGTTPGTDGGNDGSYKPRGGITIGHGDKP